MSTINKTDFMASLSRLESMAKGQGATQLHHTPSDSDPGQHAGTSTSDYQDEHNDGIDDNGTDYNGVKKALAAKVSKSKALTPAEVAIVKGQADFARGHARAKQADGQRLTQAESWVLKSGYSQMEKAFANDAMAKVTTPEYAGVAKGNDKPQAAGTPGDADSATSVPDSHGGESEQDEIEADAKKSLRGGIAQTSELRKGLEMSPILAEFANAIGYALQGTEARVQKSVAAALSPLVQHIAGLENTMRKSFSEQNDFNNGVAQAIVGIGQHVAGTSEVVAAQAYQPAAGPKAVMRPQQYNQQPQNGPTIVEKSFVGGLNTGTNALNKSQVTDVMFELVKKGQLNQLDLIKFETDGGISPQVEQLVMTHAAAMGR